MIRKIELLGAGVTVLLSLAVLLFLNSSQALATLVGGAISLVSFEISHVILRRMLTKASRKSIGKIALFVVLKVGVLFVIVPYLILRLGVEPIGFVIGFSAVILSITLIGLTRIKEVGDA